MVVGPFLKWAGGKRWLVSHDDFRVPEYTGRYIEPFLGGGAVFFKLLPAQSMLSDINPRLIEAYSVVRDHPAELASLLEKYHKEHSKDFYYLERERVVKPGVARAAQFIYLNRTCWNGLYRENLSGKFNVPIGTKTSIFNPEEDFTKISKALENTDLRCADFSEPMLEAREGDLLFIDPPYTTAHNLNGFVKYNQNIFSWADQIKVRDLAVDASMRGVKVIITNANHESITDLYADVADITSVNRASVISGKNRGRQKTSELLISIKTCVS